MGATSLVQKVESVRQAADVPMKAAMEEKLADLEEYRRIKHAIAEEIRSLGEFHREGGSRALAMECRELMERLAEDRFNLAVVGQFKRGKSSIMNALIGRDLLPTGVLPLTSVIVNVRHGPQERLVIRRGNGLYPESFPISNLFEYATEKGNPGNTKGVVRAHVETPAEFLRPGLDFVDTPGIGSATDANTEAARRFLPHCDAAIFVTAVDTPLTRMELDFLGTVLGYVGKIFFVVNKTDLVNKAELDEILQYIREVLSREMQLGPIRLFPVSSKLAMEASIRQDTAGYALSGMADLKSHLARFLAYERKSTFLAAMADRALRLASGAETAARLAEFASRGSVEGIAAIRRELEARLGQLREERTDLETVSRRQLTAWLTERLVAPLQGFFQSKEDELFREMKQLLERHPRQGRRKVLERVVRYSKLRLACDLDGWMAESLEHLKPDFSAKLQQIASTLELHLGRIPRVAAEVLGLDRVEMPEVGPTFRDPHLGNLAPLGPLRFDWPRHLPVPLGFLPVVAAGRSTQETGKAQIRQLFAVCSDTVTREATRYVGEVLAPLFSRAEDCATRAGEAILQVLDKGGPSVFDRRGTGCPLPTARLAEIEERLCTIREAIHTGPDLSREIPTPSSAHLKEPGPVAPEPPGIDTDIEKDLGTRGCPVCARLGKSALAFLAKWQYALAHEKDTQLAFARETGFCPLHSWHLASVSSPLGLCLGYPRLLERLEGELSRLSSSAFGADELSSLVKDSRDCRVCRLLQDVERTYLADLAHFLEEPRGQQVYAQSHGLCLRHLAALTRILPSKPLRQFLAAQAARKYARLAEDMRNFAMKRDALRKDLLNRDERDAHHRALIHIAGAKHLWLPQEADPEI